MTDASEGGGNSSLRSVVQNESQEATGASATTASVPSTPRPEDKGEWGYRVVNPGAPPSEPRILAPLDPQFQARAERILNALIDKWEKE